MQTRLKSLQTLIFRIDANSTRNRLAVITIAKEPNTITQRIQADSNLKLGERIVGHHRNTHVLWFSQKMKEVDGLVRL